MQTQTPKHQYIPLPNKTHGDVSCNRVWGGGEAHHWDSTAVKGCQVGKVQGSCQQSYHRGHDGRGDRAHGELQQYIRTHPGLRGREGCPVIILSKNKVSQRTDLQPQDIQKCLSREADAIIEEGVGLLSWDVPAIGHKERKDNRVPVVG